MEIKVIFVSFEGSRKVRKFKTLAGAQKYAHEMVGAHPEISEFGYAVGKFGDTKIAVDGATLEQLFPAKED